MHRLFYTEGYHKVIQKLTKSPRTKFNKHGLLSGFAKLPYLVFFFGLIWLENALSRNRAQF